MLGLEDKIKRFSEEVVDTDLKDSVRLQKLYRQIQRQVHCRDREKEVAVERVVLINDNIFIHYILTDLSDELPPLDTACAWPHR